VLKEGTGQPIRELLGREKCVPQGRDDQGRPEVESVCWFLKDEVEGGAPGAMGAAEAKAERWSKREKSQIASQGS
jgi:hypothetical protein